MLPVCSVASSFLKVLSACQLLGSEVPIRALRLRLLHSERVRGNLMSEGQALLDP